MAQDELKIPADLMALLASEAGLEVFELGGVRYYDLPCALKNFADAQSFATSFGLRCQTKEEQEHHWEKRWKREASAGWAFSYLVSVPWPEEMDGRLMWRFQTFWSSTKAAVAWLFYGNVCNVDYDAPFNTSGVRCVGGE